jgi:hypothetical protein
LLLTAVRYYWRVSKGYRLDPWNSPYILWRMETYFGHEADGLSAAGFFRLLWRERARLRPFLRWVQQGQREHHGFRR